MVVSPAVTVHITPIERPAGLAEAAKPQPTQPQKAPFQPAPPIRPTVQDTIDVDRTLLALRT